MKKAWILLAIGFSLSASPSAYAADSSTTRLGSLRSVDQASVAQKKIKEEQQKQQPELAYTQPEVKVQIKPPAEGAIPEISFFVRKIRLEGNTVFSTEELELLAAPYENKEVTFGTLKELTQAISKKYRDKGFRTSFAYLPRQQVQDEEITIAILEGKVGNILVEGNRFFRKKRIRSYLKMKTGEILNAKKIEAALRYLNENSDRLVEVRLAAGQELQTTDIILTVKDNLPLHPRFNYDNEGSKSSGKQRFSFSLTDQNLTSLDDVFTIGTVFGRHFGFITTQYELPFPKTDTKLVTAFSHGQSTPTGDLKPLGVNGISQLYSGGVEQSLLRQNHIAMNVSAGFEFIDSRTVLQNGTFTRERLRILQLAPKTIIAGSWGATVLIQEFRFGLNTMGASIHADPAASRQGVRPEFFVFKGQLHHSQNMPFDTNASIQIKFQHPSRKLPAQEELSLGGASTVRGYPEGDYLADTGFYMSFEYLIPTYFFPEAWQFPFSKTPLRKQVQLVAFVDDGYGRLRGPSSIEARTRHLLGTGGGLRIKVFENIFARFEWAAALGNQPLGNGNIHEFYFRLQVEK